MRPCAQLGLASQRPGRCRGCGPTRRARPGQPTGSAGLPRAAGLALSGSALLRGGAGRDAQEGVERAVAGLGREGCHSGYSEQPDPDGVEDTADGHRGTESGHGNTGADEAVEVAFVDGHIGLPLRERKSDESEAYIPPRVLLAVRENRPAAACAVHGHRLGSTRPMDDVGCRAGTRVERMHERRRFDEEAATWDEAPGHEERQVAVAHAIEQAVSLNPGMRALDVGCGTGRLSILLSDRVGSVVVTDPSAGMVQVAQERIEAAELGDRLRVVQADLTKDPLDGAFDVVWSSLALHHVQDLDGLLRSVAGLLVNGGRLAFADLDEDPAGAFHAEKIDFDGHHGFDRQRLAERLVQAGFAEVSFVDATTILKDDRKFGVFLCTATKGA